MITDDLAKNYVANLTEGLAKLAGSMAPADFALVLGTTIANLAGVLPESYLERMTEHMGEPCAREGCRCHVYAAQMKKAILAGRADYLESERLSQAPGSKLNS